MVSQRHVHQPIQGGPFGAIVTVGGHCRHLLGIGQQQLVEIAKALSRDAKVIAFDHTLSLWELTRLYGFHFLSLIAIVAPMK